MAQSIQMDFGSFNAQPSAAYGAAAAQPGVWNHITSASPVALVDVSGAATTAVFAPSISANFGFGFDNILTNGDDGLLLDGAHDGAMTIDISGLLNGTYDVYTYAWAPDNRISYLTNVDVTGSANPAQSVGGADWSGAHVLGVTYAKHSVAVSTGTLQIVCTVGSGFATINGVQLDPQGIAPTTYCTAKTTAGGCVPSIGYSGSASATAGSGFLVQGTSFINNKSCLLFYGTAGQSATPFQGGTLCVKSPIKRTPGTTTGGNPPPNDCSGVPAIDMNLFAVGGGGGSPLPALTIPGTVIDCQWWGRDPGFIAPNNTQLSDGLHYVIGP